jgi:sulfoxide reductase heme-binding subunit YedZ
MNDALWYTARGTGAVLLLLLTVTVVLGITSRSGRTFLGLPRFAVSAVHRNASLIAVGLLVVHMLTLLADPYAQLKVADLVVPFGGADRPFWLGLGTLAADLIGVLVVTSLVRHRLGARAWRSIHWLAYAAWPFGLLHALGIGSDAGTLWLRLVAGTSLAGVLAAVVWRLSPRFVETTGVRRPLLLSDLDGRR